MLQLQAILPLLSEGLAVATGRYPAHWVYHRTTSMLSSRHGSPSYVVLLLACIQHQTFAGTMSPVAQPPSTPPSALLFQPVATRQVGISLVMQKGFAVYSLAEACLRRTACARLTFQSMA